MPVSPRNITENISIEPWWWRFGRPAEIWTKYERVSRKIIKKHNLKPAISMREPAAAERLSIAAIDDIRGGRRVPHLHYKGDIYLLDSKQWQDFSDAVVQDLSKRLLESKQIRFHELLEISDSISPLI